MGAGRWVRGDDRSTAGAGQWTPDERRGFTLLELLIVIALIAVLASFAMVGITRSRARGQEAAAISALRAIHSAQDAFRATCGHDRDYAMTLVQLGKAQTISPDMAAAETVSKSGYTITLTSTAPGEGTDSCTEGETAAHWYATAVPTEGGPHRAFATTDNDDIWQNLKGAAPPVPFTPSADVSLVER